MDCKTYSTLDCLEIITWPYSDIWNPITVLYTCLVTNYRQHFTLKSHLLLVNFYPILYQFYIKSACFHLIFTTYIQFDTHVVVLYIFEHIKYPMLLAFLKKLVYMLISSQTSFTKFIRNQLIAKFDGSINHCRKN